MSQCMSKSPSISCPKCGQRFMPAAKVICICGASFMLAHSFVSAGAAEPPPMAALAMSTATSIGAVTQYFVDGTTDDVREAPGPGFDAGRARASVRIIWNFEGRLLEAIPDGDMERAIAWWLAVTKS